MITIIELDVLLIDTCWIVISIYIVKYLNKFLNFIILFYYYIMLYH